MFTVKLKIYRAPGPQLTESSDALQCVNPAIPVVAFPLKAFSMAVHGALQHTVLLSPKE